MMREVIHIGFPKTATTTLQDHLFGMHPGIMSVARPFADKRIGDLCTALAIGDDMEFDQAGLSAAVGRARSQARAVIIYSDETVVNTSIRSIAAKRLKALMPDAHVLAVLRSQTSSLASMYANSGRRLRPAPEPYGGRHVNFEEYLTFNFANPSRGFLQTLDYARILSVYEKLFGRERVHVLLFEEFISDPRAFAGKLAKVLGLDPGEVARHLEGRHSHQRTAESVARYQALRSRFLWGVPLSRVVPGAAKIKKVLFAFWGDKPLKVVYPGDWESKIGDLFREGNRAISDKYGPPLERYGYPL
ncbi:MAG: hypothetical protein VX871_07535 [Pseudomonadota bacterium]|nr:hypothetical protein [Pseudomonadota bacterium]